MSVTVRATTPADVPAILAFVHALADYERAPHEVKATQALLHDALFGARPAAECVFAEHDGRAIGFALFFQNFSTWTGKPGLYLEDLFVLPDARGLGAGKALLAHLAALCIERDYTRFEWSVLDWNSPAIGFYESLGARPQDEWTVFRLSGAALSELATHAR